MVEFSIDGGSLREAATWVARLCPTRHATPILQGVLLEADDELTLSAYDFETAGSATIPALVLKPGRALISGRLLAAIAKTLDENADVTISVTDTEATMRVGRNNWRLPTLPLDDYPELPATGEPAAKFDGAVLRGAIDRVLPAADRSNVEPLRGAMAIKSAGETVSLVALHRHRMAVATIPWAPAVAGAEIDLLVPTEFLEACSRALGSRSAAAELGYNSGALYLLTPSHRLTGRLVAGEWPRWEGLLPSVEPAASAIFVVRDLASAVDRVLAVIDEKRAGQPVRFDIGPDGFAIESVADTSSANAEAAVSEFTGEPRMLAVNPRFLRDALDTMQSDLALLRVGPLMRNPLDLVPLDESGKPETDYRHIVMPIHPDKLQRRP